MRSLQKIDYMSVLLLLPILQACQSGEPIPPQANDTTSLASSAAERDTKEKARIGLCNKDETEYFSCTTTNSKHASICGSNDKPRPTSVSYNFGTQEEHELEHTSTINADDPGSFFQNNYHRYQAIYIEVSFQRLGYEYRIFRRTASDASPEEGQKDTKTNYGVEVNRADTGKELSSITCKSVEHDRMNDLIEILPCDKDSALGCSD